MVACEAEGWLGSPPGLTSLVLSRITALLQSGGRLLDALLGIQGGFGRELRQPGLAIEEPLRLALDRSMLTSSSCCGERTDRSRVRLSVRSCAACCASWKTSRQIAW